MADTSIDRLGPCSSDLITLLSEMPAADLGADDDSGQAQEAHLPQKPHHLLLPHQIPQIWSAEIAFPALTVGAYS